MNEWVLFYLAQHGAFAPVLETRIPAYLQMLHWQEHSGNEICLHILPRRSEWIRIELPVLIKRSYGIAKAILKDEDDAREAVAAAVMSTEAVPHEPQNFQAYLDRATRTASWQILRRRIKEKTNVSLDDLAKRFDLWYDGPSPEDETIRSEIVALTKAAVARLPEFERRVLQLHLMEDLTIRQTATTLNIDAYSVQNAVHRARKKLVRQLGPLFVRTTQ